MKRQEMRKVEIFLFQLWVFVLSWLRILFLFLFDLFSFGGGLYRDGGYGETRR